MAPKNLTGKFENPSNQFAPMSRSDLRVVGVMMVKNEADVIRACVTNNLRFCDSFVFSTMVQVTILSPFFEASSEKDGPLISLKIIGWAITNPKE
jgi:hypothetical protein